MALQIARDVFVRRPECFSLWVAPADRILARSGEQWDEVIQESAESDSTQSFLLFARPNQRESYQVQREIKAGSADEALDRFHEADPKLARLGVWAVPLEHIHRSEIGDAAAWFQPAHSKAFRHGSFYHPDQLLRRLRKSNKDQDDD
jgi:1,2-phenylacetyl-CoA epoxidase PaaB subunit